MKGQRYRFRLIALLLISLLILTGIHGARTIPLTGPDVSLRDAILRLTGRASPTPLPEVSPSPGPDETGEPMESAVPSTAPDSAQDNTLGQILFPQASSTPTTFTSESSISVTPAPTSLVDTPGQVLFPQVSSTTAATASEPPPSVTSALPLSEALSSYFGTEAPE